MPIRGAWNVDLLGLLYSQLLEGLTELKLSFVVMHARGTVPLQPHVSMQQTPDLARAPRETFAP